MALGFPFGRAGRVLSMLRVQAAVLRLETGEWARIDRLVHAAPTWVGRADAPVPDLV